MKAAKFVLSGPGIFLILAGLLGSGSALLCQAPTAQAGPQPQSAPSAANSSSPAVSKPSGPAPILSTSPATPAALTSDEARALLDTLFLTESRIKDLVGSLDTANWKMPDIQRQQMNQSIELVLEKIQALEKCRYQYYYDLKNSGDQRKTQAALKSLMPAVASLCKAVDQYQGAAAAGPLQQASRELAGVAEQFQPRPSSLEAGEQAVPSPPVAAQPVQAAPQAAPPSSEPAPVPAGITASAASNAPTMTPAETRAVLDKLFLTESRIKDLLGTLQTTSWKMTDTGRQEIDQSLSSAQQKIQDLERWRYQFYYHLDNVADGRKTEAAIQSLQPVVSAIGAAASQHQGSPTGAQFQQASGNLESVATELATQLSEMEAHMKALLSPGAGVPGGHAVETEVIKGEANIRPLSSMVTTPPPLSAPQVKQLLYQVYVQAFRIKDLLSQERPEKWKAPAAEINAFNASRRDLLKNLASLDRWREQLAERPADLNLSFQTYVSIDRVLNPLEGVTLRVARYENASLAANYQKAASHLRTAQNDLLPYLTFLFAHHDQAVQNYQVDLATCQNKLGYAMHGLEPRATLMKNVLPQFQGRRVREQAHRQSAAAAPAPRKHRAHRASSRRARHKRRHHTTHAVSASSGKS